GRRRHGLIGCDGRRVVLQVDRRIRHELVDLVIVERRAFGNGLRFLELRHRRGPVIGLHGLLGFEHGFGDGPADGFLRRLLVLVGGGGRDGHQSHTRRGAQEGSSKRSTDDLLVHKAFLVFDRTVGRRNGATSLFSNGNATLVWPISVSNG